MAEDKPRLARLTAILTQLQSKRIVTATALAEKHGVSVRTIYRDIRTLEQSGVPIFAEEGKGYSLVEGYQLAPVMFTEEEANALITAEVFISNSVDESFSQQLNSAIEKIKAVLKGSTRDQMQMLSERLDIRLNTEEKAKTNLLIRIQSAITQYKVVHINYHSLANKETERDIEPFALIRTYDHWILIAFCRLRKDFRAFRLDCIQELKESGENFEAHQLSLEQYFEMRRKVWEKEG